MVPYVCTNETNWSNYSLVIPKFQGTLQEDGTVLHQFPYLEVKKFFVLF